MPIIASYGVRLLNIFLILGGIAVLIAFIFIERKVAKPLLPMRIFRIRILTFSIMASFFQSLGFLAVVFIIIMYHALNHFRATSCSQFCSCIHCRAIIYLQPSLKETVLPLPCSPCPSQGRRMQPR